MATGLEPASDREELAEIALELRSHLAWLHDNGLRDLPALGRAAGASALEAAPAVASVGSGRASPPPSLRAAVRAAAGASGRRAAGAAPVPVPAPEAAAPPAASAPATEPAPRDLEQIRAELGDCKRCKLCEKRKNIVFGVGSPSAQLVFVGEGPGADEDAQGIPFVGAAGQLLTKMIEAMGFQRDEVYICNVVKCRPPGNRDPEAEEIAACEPFLKAQLAVLKPKAIVALGKFATLTLLREPNGSITRMRGQWRSYAGIPLMPTFHPSYLLHQKTKEGQYQEKKKVWDDLQQVMKVLGKAPPAKGAR